jgi:hypothetical protein
MFRSFMVAAASAAVLMFAATAFAQQDHGTAAEAKAMLTKTVSALKADKAKTLDLINEGKGGSLIATFIRFASTSAPARALRLPVPIRSKHWGWT